MARSAVNSSRGEDSAEDSAWCRLSGCESSERGGLSGCVGLGEEDLDRMTVWARTD